MTAAGAGGPLSAGAGRVGASGPRWQQTMTRVQSGAMAAAGFPQAAYQQSTVAAMANRARMPSATGAPQGMARQAPGGVPPQMQARQQQMATTTQQVQQQQAMQQSRMAGTRYFFISLNDF